MASTSVDDLTRRQRAGVLTALEIARSTTCSVEEALSLMEKVRMRYMDKPVPESFINTVGNQILPPPALTYYDLLDKMRETHDKKNADYAASEDQWRNFRQSESLGIPAHVGAFIRLGDKYMRAQNLLQREWQKGDGPAVSDESVDDTLIDLAVYALITLLMRREWKAKAGLPYLNPNQVRPL